MHDEIFFDTNVLAYVYDESESEKRRVCAKLVQNVFDGQLLGIVSNQILAELYASLTERLRKPMPKMLAMSVVEAFIVSEKWTKINYNEKTVSGALDILKKRNGTIFDAIIVETMKENGIRKIFTEDKFFKKIPSIVAINPFKK